MTFPTRLTATLLFALAATATFAAGKAAHVVVLVWDGMRPEFVTPEAAPTLCLLAREGVTFKNHHSVFISTTEVNGTALATGGYPERSGIVGNREYRPAINLTNTIATESLTAVRKGDQLTGGRYLALPTVAELLQARGRRTAVAGAKQVALLHDRAEREADAASVTIFEGRTLPVSFTNYLCDCCGAFPAGDKPRAERDAWTTSALLKLWERGVPPYSLLWLSEPDHTQHRTGPGSEAALAAIRNSDQQLARVLAALDERKLRDQTDVIIVSDHAFSTVSHNHDVAAILQTNGLPARRDIPAGGLRPDDVLIVNNGGASFFYVGGQRREQIERVVRVLQAQPFCGVLFTRVPVSGAFRLADVKLDAPTAPDIVMSFRWGPERNTNGIAGSLHTDTGGYKPNQGAHGSLSAFDMHNTCVAAGPDFRRGVQSFLPSGNVDIAPTVLAILGVKPKVKPSGRVLTEAFAGESTVKVNFQPRHLAAEDRAATFTWSQYLNFSEVNGVVYFDEGNGAQTPGR
jgi:arylsulfatase A-like enzyme